MDTPSELQSIIEEFEKIAQTSIAQIFFSGGHGGLVHYDGQGGPMVKEGGPMDRLFLLRSRGELGGDIGLDIFYGNIKFVTGMLRGDVEISDKGQQPVTCIFYFNSNEDTHAIEIRGGIEEVSLPFSELLFSSSVEVSRMRWLVGQEQNPTGSLPYTAYHRNAYIHPKLLDYFDLPADAKVDAVSGWCKRSPVEMHFDPAAKQGSRFRTQQHLGNLRVFVRE